MVFRLVFRFVFQHPDLYKAVYVQGADLWRRMTVEYSSVVNLGLKNYSDAHGCQFPGLSRQGKHQAFVDLPTDSH